MLLHNVTKQVIYKSDFIYDTISINNATFNNISLQVLLCFQL